VLVDAYLKNITQGIDWNLAYEALVTDAEVEPPNWDIEGRSGPPHFGIHTNVDKVVEVLKPGKLLAISRPKTLTSMVSALKRAPYHGRLNMPTMTLSLPLWLLLSDIRRTTTSTSDAPATSTTCSSQTRIPLSMEPILASRDSYNHAT
jgi:hypothetical protein